MALITVVLRPVEHFSVNYKTHYIKFFVRTLDLVLNRLKGTDFDLMVETVKLLV